MLGFPDFLKGRVALPLVLVGRGKENMSIRSLVTLLALHGGLCQLVSAQPVIPGSTAVEVTQAVDLKPLERVEATSDPDRLRGNEAVRTAATAPGTSRNGSFRRGHASRVLPNDAGQVWREYDISPYTLRVSDREHPERAVVDWVLRETGTDLWFTEPLGLLNASQHRLRVYHTPEVQETVASVVDRFLSTSTESHAFAMRLITVASPGWRSQALRTMTPVTVRTPGTEAWLVSKEEAVLLLNHLRGHSGYREHGTPDLLIYNGQQEALEYRRPRQYSKSVIFRPATFSGYEMKIGQIQEGFSLQLTPLMSRDGRTVDAVIKAQVDQIEKLQEVPVDVPGPGGRSQRVVVQIPRLSGWQLHERFRWPADKVLVISRGVVATPAPVKNRRFLFNNSMNAFGQSRGDALLILECLGPVVSPITGKDSGARVGNTRFQGRY